MKKIFINHVIIIPIKKKKFFFKDITDEDDSLQEYSSHPLPKYYESEYNINDFYNKIPKTELKDIEIDKHPWDLDENLNWVQVKPISKRLKIHDEKELLRLEKRQNISNLKQQHMLGIYLYDFDATQYEDKESEYYGDYHNKFTKNKIQSLYDNYKREYNNRSPLPIQYNDQHQLT
jgi:hypothetical protein